LITARLFGRNAAYITACLLALSTMLILYTPFLLIATLQAFWITLIAYLSVKCIELEIKSSRTSLLLSSIYWGVLGLLCACAILTRGNIWFFIPGILAVFFYIRFKVFSSKMSLFQKFLPLIVFIFALLLPQLPFAWHNSNINGALCGPSTAGSAVLSLGNTPQTPPGGREPGTGAGPMEYPPVCKYWMKTSKNVSVVNRILLWLKNEPAAFCELQFRKLMLFWDYAEIPNNIAVEQNGMKSPTLKFAGGIFPKIQKSNNYGSTYSIYKNIIPTSIILLVLSFAGGLLYLIMLFKPQSTGKIKLLNHLFAHPKIYLILYFVIAYNFATAAFYNLSRFRAPLIPLLAVFAGGFVILFVKFAKKSKKNFLTFLATFLIAIFVVIFSFSFYRNFYEASIMTIVRPNGTMVDLGSYTTIEDNGPFSFGGWDLIPFRKGEGLVKTFNIPSNLSKIKSFTFSLPIVWMKAGNAELLINGKRIHISNNRAGRKIYEFSVIKPTIIITLFNTNSSLMLIADYQRNYQRTVCNSKKMPFELVGSLNFRN
jgi:4-amino-4-deoxy-L-arabinose transferase-like glycosyltransferase